MLVAKKTFVATKMTLVQLPPMKPVMPIHLQSVKRLSPKTDGFVVSSHWKLDGLLCVRVIVSQRWFPRCCLFVFLSFFFSPKYETVVQSLATTKLTQFVFLISCNPLRPIV